MRISDWSSDVCSSDLKIAVEWLSKHAEVRHVPTAPPQSMIIISENRNRHVLTGTCGFTTDGLGVTPGDRLGLVQLSDTEAEAEAFADWFQANWCGVKPNRSEEHTSELQSLMRISYAVFCLKKKKT